MERGFVSLRPQPETGVDLAYDFAWRELTDLEKIQTDRNLMS